MLLEGGVTGGGGSLEPGAAALASPESGEGIAKTEGGGKSLICCPAARASAFPYLRTSWEKALRFRHLTHRSAAAHKLHSTQQRLDVISGMVKPSTGDQLSLCFPESIQTTGTNANKALFATARQSRCFLPAMVMTTS